MKKLLLFSFIGIAFFQSIMGGLTASMERAVVFKVTEERPISPREWFDAFFIPLKSYEEKNELRALVGNIIEQGQNNLERFKQLEKEIEVSDEFSLIFTKLRDLNNIEIHIFPRCEADKAFEMAFFCCLRCISYPVFVHSSEVVPLQTREDVKAIISFFKKTTEVLISRAQECLDLMSSQENLRQEDHFSLKSLLYLACLVGLGDVCDGCF